MRRRVFHLGSAISALFCLAAVLLLVRSYWVADDIRRDSYSVGANWAKVWTVEAYCDRGELSLGYERDTNPNPQKAMSGVNWFWYVDVDPPTPTRFKRSVRGGSVFGNLAGQTVYLTWHGFEFSYWPSRTWGSPPPGYSNRRTEIHVPFWFLAAITSLLPLAWINWKRKQKPGHCRNCYYDLTGNTSGVCPECGKPFIQPTAKTGGPQRC